jgi:MFS family permease
LIDIDPLRRFPDFRRMWIGYSIRQIGTQLTVAAVLFQVFQITHSNLAVGLVSIAQLIPGILAAMIGGAIADAMDRRKVLIVTATLISLCTVGLAVNSMGSHTALWPIFVLSGTSWALVCVDTPTRTAVMFTLVDRDSYVSATVLRSVMQQGAAVIGPLVAGVLIGLTHEQFAIVYWIDVAGTLAAFMAIWSIPSQTPAGGGRKFGFSSIVEGLQFLKHREVILACLITDFTANVLGFPQSLFPYMATVRFHGGPYTYGLLVAAPGVGAIAGSIFSGWTPGIRRQGLAVLLSAGVWGMAFALFGVVPWLWLGLILVVIAGWGNVISVAFRSSILQYETPDDLRGRLTALSLASGQAGPRLGNAEAGIVAALVSVPFSIVSGGIGCVIGMLVVAKLYPDFLHYESPHLKRKVQLDERPSVNDDESTA